MTGTSRFNLFVDLDGVVADFDAGFPRLFGLNHKEMPEARMWEMIEGHVSYFEALDLMPDALVMFDALRCFSPTILTACPSLGFDKACAGKRAWVARHLGEEIPVITVRGGRNKPLHMTAPGDILVDDWPRNIAAWEAAGGRGILFRSPDQALREVLSIAEAT